jgi:hypothetical protein
VDISNKSMWFNRLFFLLTAVVLPALGYLSVSALIGKYRPLQHSDLQKKKAKTVAEAALHTGFQESTQHRSLSQDVNFCETQLSKKIKDKFLST